MQKRIIVVIFLLCAVSAILIIVGLSIGSLGLLAEAAHMLIDLSFVLIAWWAHRVAQQERTSEHTFGFTRARVIADLLNAWTLLLLLAGIAGWALMRLFVSPSVVEGKIVAVTAAASFLLMCVAAAVLRPIAHREGIRGTHLHIKKDLWFSAGIIASGAGIFVTGWMFIDPLVSLCIAAFAGWEAMEVFRAPLRILMERAPHDMSVKRVRSEIEIIRGVAGVTDLHVWQIGEKEDEEDRKIFLTCHVAINDEVTSEEGDDIRCVIAKKMEKLGIDHATIQLERPACAAHEPLVRIETKNPSRRA